MKDRIDTILVKQGIFNTRQKAKYAIENKNVYINGICIQKAGKLVEEDEVIEITGEILPYVSRGGLKLEKAIQIFQIQLQDKICMDIGASTGGFTDCMLQQGAKKVYAVDVGHGQLADALCTDERVVNQEGTNIKDIITSDFEALDFISIDVAFISLMQVLDKAKDLLKEEGELVILIKPQFEAGKEYLSKNGVVKDSKIHRKILEKILLYSSSLGLQIKGLTYSPIKGPAGNKEYLVYLHKTINTKFDLFKIRKEIEQVVENAKKELK